MKIAGSASDRSLLATTKSAARAGDNTGYHHEEVFATKHHRPSDVSMRKQFSGQWVERMLLPAVRTRQGQFKGAAERRPGS